MKHFQKRELRCYALSVPLSSSELGGPRGVNEWVVRHANVLREATPKLRLNRTPPPLIPPPPPNPPQP